MDNFLRVPTHLCPRHSPLQLANAYTFVCFTQAAISALLVLCVWYFSVNAKLQAERGKKRISRCLLFRSEALVVGLWYGINARGAKTSSSLAAHRPESCFSFSATAAQQCAAQRNNKKGACPTVGFHWWMIMSRAKQLAGWANMDSSKRSKLVKMFLSLSVLTAIVSKLFYFGEIFQWALEQSSFQEGKYQNFPLVILQCLNRVKVRTQETIIPFFLLHL